MKRLPVLLLLGLAALPVAAATIRVHPGERIDVAISRASPGDSIEIERGLYLGGLRIDKPLRLVGVGRPTISGDGKGDVIRIASPDVRIEGVIVRDSGDDLGAQNAGIYIQPGSDRAVVSHCDFAHVLFGLWIEKSNQVSVEDNLITGMREKFSSQRGNAIQLYNTEGASIVRNHISFARDGRRFYATLHTDGRFLLVEGALAERRLRVVHEGVECPSLSPRPVPGLQRQASLGDATGRC